LTTVTTLTVKALSQHHLLDLWERGSRAAILWNQGSASHCMLPSPEVDAGSDCRLDPGPEEIERCWSCIVPASARICGPGQPCLNCGRKKMEFEVEARVAVWECSLGMYNPNRRLWSMVIAFVFLPVAIWWQAAQNE